MAASLEVAAPKSQDLSAKVRRYHRKKAKYHRKKAAYHRRRLVLNRKRAKHMRTWAMILDAEKNDVVLEGKIAQKAAKLHKKADTFEEKAAWHEAEALKHEALAADHAALGAPKASFGVAAAAVQAAHGTGKPGAGAALLVRRGSFVRLGLQVGEGCVSPGFQLRDVASDTTLSLPLLARADGLALTAANREGLALKDGDKADAVRQHMGESLGGDVASKPKTKKNMKFYAERVASGGTPFYSVVVERVTPPGGGSANGTITRAAVALWLPEHTPFGAYGLRFACDGQPRTQALPLVVVFNPLAATTAEYLVDKKAVAAGLAHGDSIDIGPLRIPFKTNADWEARDAALALTTKLPLSARAHAALVARLGRRGPIQLTGKASYKSAGSPFGDAAGQVWQDVKGWNDATGHFDLWEGGKGAMNQRPGRWSTSQQNAQVVFGSAKENYALGAKKGGHVGRWTFDDSAAQDVSGLMSKGGKLPKHNRVKVRATVHFIDDWQGETAFMKVGTGAYDSAFVAGETNAVKQSKLSAGYPQGSADEVKKGADGYNDSADKWSGKEPWEWTNSTEILTTWRKGGDSRVKYGQCWVFASLSNAMLRSVGVPTRTLTNFDSAHEKSGLPAGVGPFSRGFATTRQDGKGEAQWDFDPWYELFVKQGGDPKRALGYQTWNTKIWANDLKTKGPGESVWSFHVWTEAYGVTGGDKASTGWNVIDSTPQEGAAAWEETGTAGAKEVDAARDIKDGPAILMHRNPAVWFYPGHTRVHIRSGS